MTPQRIQLQRTKGYRKPAGAREVGVVKGTTEATSGDHYLDIPEGAGSFTKGRPFRVNADDLTKNWGGRGRNRFACGLCLNRFEIGDVVRWVYCQKAPNGFVCQACDGSDARERLVAFWADVVKPIMRLYGDYGGAR